MDDCEGFYLISVFLMDLSLGYCSLLKCQQVRHAGLKQPLFQTYRVLSAVVKSLCSRELWLWSTKMIADLLSAFIFFNIKKNPVKDVYNTLFKKNKGYLLCTGWIQDKCYFSTASNSYTNWTCIVKYHTLAIYWNKIWGLLQRNKTILMYLKGHNRNYHIT